MSTKPRVPSALPGQPAQFGTVMAHAPATIESFAALYAELWQHGTVPAPLKEMTRLRNARITDCGY